MKPTTPTWLELENQYWEVDESWSLRTLGTVEAERRKESILMAELRAKLHPPEATA